MKEKIKIYGLKNIIFLIIIAISGVIASSYAFFYQSDNVENKFEVGTPSLVIEQTLDPEDSHVFTPQTDPDTGEEVAIFDHDVYVRNYGTSDTLVRVGYTDYLYDDFVVSSWIDKHWYVTPVGELNSDDYVIKNWTQEFLDNWTYYNGWYYYNKIFEGSEEFKESLNDGMYNSDPNLNVNTMKIMDSLDFSKSPYYRYDILFEVEGIQPTVEAVKEVWGIDVVISGNGDVEWLF